MESKATDDITSLRTNVTIDLGLKTKQ
jgi:hypothetical protein